MEDTGRPKHDGVWLASTAFDFALAAIAWWAWIDPEPFSPEVLRMIMVTMNFEFFVLPITFASIAAAKVERRMDRIGYFIFGGGFALLMVVMVTLQVRRLWPLIAFVTLLLNRAMPLLSARRNRFEDMRAKYAGVLLIFSWIGCAFVAGPAPELGLSSELAASLDVAPRQLSMQISFAALYFTAAAISEIVATRAAEEALQKEMEAKRVAR